MSNNSNITLSLEHFNLLMGEIRDLKNEVKNLREIVDNVDTNTNTIKRTFTKASKKEPQKTKAEKIATLSASILKRGKKIA